MSEFSHQSLCLLHFLHIYLHIIFCLCKPNIFCRGLFLLLLLTSCILFPWPPWTLYVLCCNGKVQCLQLVKASHWNLWLQDPLCVSETHHHNPLYFVWCCSCWNEQVYWHHNHHSVGWCCCILLKQMGPGNHHHLCSCWCCYILQRQMGPGMLAPSTTELLLIMTMLRFVQDFFDL